MTHLVHFAALFVFWFYVILLVISPIVLRIQFRYNAKVDPGAIALEDLPEDARAFIEPRVAEFAPWNFDLVAYVSLPKIVGSTEAYLALLTNSHTSEWANVTFVISPAKKSGYIEFITRCSEQMQIDTTTNSTEPVLFLVPQYQVFRFPQVGDVFTLYRVHRMLVTEITHGALPVLPPAGGEIAELKRRLDRYGPWQQERGYMYLDARGEHYRLTWKGAILGAWRSIWPIPAVRSWRLRKENQAVINRLRVAT
jgi:hypothetical protein